MATGTESKSWSAVSYVSVSGGLGLNTAGTIYLFRNKDNGDKFLFMLADLGVGGSFGIKSDKLGKLVKALLNSTTLYDYTAYSDIPANKAFSASDLNLARGAELTLGFAVGHGYSSTNISAWPHFSEPAAPGAVVNNDYFTGADVSGPASGLGAGGAFRMYGLWFKLWSWTS